MSTMFSSCNFADVQSVPQKSDRLGKNYQLWDHYLRQTASYDNLQSIPNSPYIYNTRKASRVQKELKCCFYYHIRHTIEIHNNSIWKRQMEPNHKTWTCKTTKTFPITQIYPLANLKSKQNMTPKKAPYIVNQKKESALWVSIQSKKVIYVNYFDNIHNLIFSETKPWQPIYELNGTNFPNQLIS